MSFQSDADGLKSKLHISEIRKPVLVVICVAILLVVFFLLQGLSALLSSNSFEVVKQDTHSSETIAGDTSARDDEEVKTVFVHVGGAVLNAGVIEIVSDARVVDAVEQAGGFSENAAIEALNLARPVQDGEQILVPTREEYERPANDETNMSGTSASSNAAGASNSKVNLNTASQAELQTLSGIGEATAKKIIAYREAKGLFQSIDDLKKVSGIGDKKFVDLADKICV